MGWWGLGWGVGGGGRGVAACEAFFRGGGFDLAVDLGAEEQHEAGDVEPGEKDDDGSEGAVGDGVGVEEVEVDAQAEGGEEPAEDADGSAGGEPAPAAGFDVGRPVVDDGEGEGEEGGGDGPAYEPGEDCDGESEVGMVDGVVGEGGEEVSAEHGGQDEGDDAGEQDRDADGRETSPEVGAGLADLVDGVEGLLYGGDTNGGGPDGGDEAEGRPRMELALKRVGKRAKRK